MKITNLEIGKYYCIKWKANGDTYIVENTEHQPSLKLDKNLFSENGNFNHSSQWEEVREATSEEREWLIACIKSKKFVPKPIKLEMQNCIPNKVYWTNCKVTYPMGYIHRFKSTTDSMMHAYSRIYLDRGGFSRDTQANNAHWEGLRDATEEEIKWLEACEKANKFISKEEALKKTDNELKIGNLYKHKNEPHLAYYCGKDSSGKPFFELKDYKAVTFDIDQLPKGWISKGNNTYWAYNNLETEFDLTPIKEDVKTNQLFTFPINGSCNTIDERLVNFLKNRQSNKLIGGERNSYSAGIGWNNSSYWYFANSSEKPKYTIEELEPFLKNVYVENKPSKEELLELARKNYPIGIIFNSPNHIGIDYEINQEVIEPEVKWCNGIITIAKTTKNYEGIVYRNGVWGEIISKAKSMEKLTTLTSLPEKWYIAVNKENLGVLNNWRHDKGKLYGAGYIVSLDNDKHGYHYSNIPKGFTEITFDQFKKWVLKENIPMKEEQWIPQVGDWIWDIKGKYLSIKENPTIITSINGDQIFSKDRNSSPSWISRQSFFDVYRKALPHEIPNLSSMEPKKEENLVGRWLKCVKNPYYNDKENSNTSSGTFHQIYSEDVISVYTKKDGNGISDFWNKNSRIPEYFELMPIGFIPPNKEESKFVVGKWYEYLYPNNLYYFKCLKVAEGRFYNDGFINTKISLGNGFTEQKCDYPLKGTEVYLGKEVSIEVIQPYLPEGHIDKLPLKTMEKFKIGDKVRCIGDSKYNKNNELASGWQKGYEFTIRSITGENIAWPGMGSCGVYFDQLELVTSSIPEYVECLNWMGSFCKQGEIYPITKYNSDINLTKCKSPHYNGEITCGSGTFRFSTREAYLAQNSPKMSLEEELLTEAKRRYPEGCIIKPMSNNIGRLNTHEKYKVTFSKWKYYPDSKNFFLEDNLLVYMDGKWAEIIHSSKEEEQKIILEEAKRRFPIGCKFHPITQLNGVSDSIYTNREQCRIYRPQDPDWWIIGSANVYCKQTGQWAEIVEYPSDLPIFLGGRNLTEVVKNVQSKPSIIIDSEVTNIKLKKSASVTLKNTEKEVVISVRKSKPILLTI